MNGEHVRHVAVPPRVTHAMRRNSGIGCCPKRRAKQFYGWCLTPSWYSRQFARHLCSISCRRQCKCRIAGVGQRAVVGCRDSSERDRFSALQLASPERPRLQPASHDAMMIHMIVNKTSNTSNGDFVCACGEGLSDAAREETNFLRLLSDTMHSTSSSLQFVHGAPCSVTLHLTLRDRQH